MPQRNRPMRKDSSLSLCSLSNDIPWFCNFGQFLGSEDFLLSTPHDSAKPVKPTRRRKKHFLDTDDSRDSGVAYFKEANVNLMASFEENDKRTDRLLRASRGPRIVSELPISMSKKIHYPQDHSAKKALNPTQSDRTDELSPSSLGSVLRRMVSFGIHEKGRNDCTVDGYIGFSHPYNVSKAQEVGLSIIDCDMNSFNDEYRSSINPHRSKGTASHMRNFPAQDSESQCNLEQDMDSNGRRRRHWRQTSKLGDASSRNLGAMIRRMVSFEKTP